MFPVDLLLPFCHLWAPRIIRMQALCIVYGRLTVVGVTRTSRSMTWQAQLYRLPYLMCRTRCDEKAMRRTQLRLPGVAELIHRGTDNGAQSFTVALKAQAPPIGFAL